MEATRLDIVSWLWPSLPTFARTCSNLTRSASGSAIWFSKSSEKLRIDFYDSGVGETIVITFPRGGLGLVDAHPSANSSRPSILDIVSGKKLHFVCLTHPHADHGVDLIPVLQRQTDIAEFWHTSPDTSSFIFFCATQRWNYPSPVRDFVNQFWNGWADFLLDLYSSVGVIP